MREMILNVENIVEQRAMYYNVTTFYAAMKRVFDVLISLLLISALLPVFIIAVVMIHLSSPGSVIVSQKRNGLKGKIFYLFDFRCITGKEDYDFTSYEVFNENQSYKLKNTKGETRKTVGDTLRKTGIEKLPRLFNVLKGDMSIVGPEPHSITQVMKYTSWQRLRLSVKPGLIPLWKTYGKDNLDQDEIIRLDLKYIKERSLWYDIKIILKSTILSKRCIDISCSLMGVVVLMPVVTIITLLIKVTSEGPILFKHKRVGQNGKPLDIYKFRTMVTNAEEMIKKFTPEQMREFQESFKLKDDPRITTVGKFLRKTSLDELPQLFNILKGEMSIVGPRPIVTEELEKYGEYADEVFAVKPGLTGMWQANGRSDTTYEERVQMDVEYVSRMNLKLDLEIIFKTFFNVLRREGAY